MDINNNSRYVTLYNTAIDKIFKGYTTLTSFHNPKHFRISSSSPVRDTDTCRKQFLSFMYNNFSDFVNTTGSVDAPTTFFTIVEKVKQFIALMEVKTMTADNQIVVTLHDIIDKLSSTSVDSHHCKSEKLFMAVLLAIQMLHCPSPSTERDYTLKFKFAQSFFGKSRLQKSSVICSGSEIGDDVEDPVAANIFGFDINALQQEQAQEVEKDNPKNLLELEVEEEQPATMLGDELFEKIMKGEGPSKEEKEMYKKIVLQKFEKGNYQVKSIEIWDYKNVSKELEKSERIRSEVLDLLSITPNGNVYNKLFYLVNIFSSILKCEDNDCLKIYLITAALLPFFHTQVGGSKSQRRHRRKPARKTRRGRTRTRKSKTKSKAKAKTHRRRRHSRVRKHKKYTSRRR